MGRQQPDPDQIGPGASSAGGELEQFRADFAELSEFDRLAAMLYGVISPHDAMPKRIVEIVAHLGLKTTGRGVGIERVRAASKRLVSAGMLERRDRSFVAALAWQTFLTIAARDAGMLSAVIAAFDATEPSRRYLTYTHRWMAARAAAVAGRLEDDDEIDEELGDVWQCLAYPGGADVVATLPSAVQRVAVPAILTHTIETGIDPERNVDACLQHAADVPGVPGWVAFIRILQGRLDGVEEVFAALPESTGDAKRNRVELASCRALVATLRGDDELALQHIREAVALEKHGTRKRNVFPDSPAFAMSLLSLVRTDSAETAALADSLIKVGERSDIQPLLLHCVIEARESRRPGPNYGLELFGQRPTFSALLNGYQCSWNDDFAAFEQRGWSEAFIEYASRAAANGWRWVEAETLELVALADVALQAQSDGDESSFRTGADALHEELGTVTLAKLAAIAEPWEFSLKELERLAFDAQKKPVRKPAAKPQSARRLAWCVIEHDYGLDVEAREQRSSKGGGWSRGRVVSLKRLRGASAELDFLTEQDRQIAAAIKEERYGYYGYRSRTEYEVDERGLYAMAGHPHVLNGAGETVEVVRREPQLLLEELSSGQLLARIEPHGDGSGNYSAVFRQPTRLEVTRFNADHKRLLEAIPAEGLTLPAAARQRLISAVTGLSSQVQIQSAIGGGGASAEVDADAAPRVRLEPAGAGLTVDVVVEPIAESGVYFAPGRGGSTVFLQLDGEPVQARRNLAGEREQWLELQRACPMLVALQDPEATLGIEDPAECLELLDQLEAATAHCLWPKGQPFRIVGRADAQQLSLAIKSAAEWFSASGELAVDEHRVIALSRLYELLDAAQSRFLALEDGQFVALTEAFRRQLQELRGIALTSRGAGLKIHPLAAPAIDALLDDCELETDGAWRAAQQRLRGAESLQVVLPSTLQADLRPYQHDGFEWLARLQHWGVGACLADDMGLGKTVQALALLVSGAADGPALVVAPTSVAPNWSAEARRFAPTLNVIRYSGTRRARRAMLDELGAYDLVVTTYGVLQNDRDELAGVQWRTAILDEAQAIKNASTRRARAAFALNADFRLATTGTPIQNNLMDLHSLFQFINPGLLGTAANFRDTYVLPIERDHDADAAARLRRVISPFVLRRLKSEVLDDLPPRTEITMHVELSTQEAALYEALRRRAVEALSADDSDAAPGERRIQVLAHLTRLRLACCHPSLVLESGAPESAKLAVFNETLSELLENRHKVLVFSQFVQHLKLIEAALQEREVSYQYLDGSTPAKARAERIDAFQRGDGDVFLISLKAGGVGLNLTAADYVIHMDPWWNPAVEDQASDRAHRIGQTRPVTIYRLVAKGTIEEQVLALHQQKRELADQLLEGTDAAGRLDAEQLLELVREPLAVTEGT